MCSMRISITSLFLTLLSFITFAQNKKASNNSVYVDEQGILRYTKSNKEAAFFGTNYTIPFAYGYRSHKALGIDLEKAIDADVYHFARLGLDAFRVHVWDTEITDSLGNLKENEHLRLFDYLLYKLKQRNIKILITPLAFWGNGYPERDEKTGSFSSIYNKQQVLVTEAAIKAQENYLQQFFKHINPYTKQTYGADADVIAMEINNEPHHSGTKQQAAGYISRMIKAVKSTGWTKPVFYNISESPRYADAVAKSDIDGVSFQWYPTGLVANHTLQGNYLPNVDGYKIPFGDTIPQYRNKARMVYEFDAGDVLQSNMYPAMARSFRTAGFQWATQFAYDPLATAYANTEYQTHYVNLAYTPSKAISLMIAGKAFHKLPRLKSYGSYPVDTVFDVFRVSYKNSLSEMNSEEEFYYSNTTTTEPRNIFTLKHIAGVGSSPIINYEGTGAYFLDKLNDGIWRLEVMPDAISIRDPFEKASPKKEVTRIQWQKNKMQIILEDLGANFDVKPVDSGNLNQVSAGNGFLISPGTYIVTERKTANDLKRYSPKTGVIGMTEFVAPKPFSTETFINHLPPTEVTAGKPFILSAKVVGIDTADKVSAELRHSAGKWKTLPLQRTSAYDYTAEVPSDVVTPGVLNYRMIVQKKNSDWITFPGGYTGNPYAWDYYQNDTWQTFVTIENSALKLFDATDDRTGLNIYNPDWRNITFHYITAEKPGQLVQQITSTKMAKGGVTGWQLYIGDKLKGRLSELTSFTKLIVRARTVMPQQKIKIGIITADAAAFTASINVGATFQNIEIPLTILKQDLILLLPRPYPGFLPLWFTSGEKKAFNLHETDKLEISFTQNGNGQQSAQPYVLEIESIWLEK